jgi:hypothetical protein
MKVYSLIQYNQQHQHDWLSPEEELTIKARLRRNSIEYYDRLDKQRERIIEKLSDVERQYLKMRKVKTTISMKYVICCQYDSQDWFN